MLDPALIMEVKRLLKQTSFSQRKIAMLTGVSRASIGAIASGRRPEYPARCNPQRDEEEEIPRGPLERCRSCGGLVFMPCLLCRVRAIKRKERDQCRARQQEATTSVWAVAMR